MPDTICGYDLADVRRSLRDAIDRRDTRAAKRWTAELIVTPGAVGSLWASYWMAWAAAQGAGSASPTMPILLRQSWGTITEAATRHVHGGEGWPAFRNDPQVRALATETTMRLLGQPRQTPVVWPSKEIILYDVSVMRDAPPPPHTDGPATIRVWQRDEDAMELRMMAGRFLAALERGDIRSALSAVAWTLLTPAQQSLPMPMKISERGSAALPPKARSSAIWFWLELGKAWLLERGTTIHRGWPTMHNAVAEAFKLHWQRWTAPDRMRVLLAWILQLRASLQEQPASLWAAPAISLTLAEVDLPYKEVATELADPQSVVVRQDKAPDPVKESKRAQAERLEARMAEADAAVLAAIGLTEDD